MKRFLCMATVMACLAFTDGIALAADTAPTAAAEGATEVKKLEKRVEELENRMKESEVVDELGHKFHPIHSFSGSKISGGITVIGQGVSRIKNANSRGAFTLSADLAIESPVGENGRVVGVLDFQRGAGLNNLPAFFAAPNGNVTGPNNDVESFNNDQLHVAQFYYEHDFNHKLFLTFGQLDPTAYFDGNVFANNEKFQLLANEFVNNPTIEFGGSDNFYGPGVRTTYNATDDVAFSAGVIEGKGNYYDTFDKPFFIAEADFKLKLGGRDGNYRAYVWDRRGRTDAVYTADPSNPDMINAENNGAGVSLDQMITDKTGVWLRAGVQKAKVAQFDRYVGAGVNVNGCYGRTGDVVGLGYGASFMGNKYKDYLRSLTPGFSSGTEHYIELYYNYAVAGAAQTTGFHISPDIQYVVNPGGDADAGNLFMYGVRLQAFF